MGLEKEKNGRYICAESCDKEVGKKKGKMFARFDLRAAFDKVDREILKERMGKIEISDMLRERIMENNENKEMKNVIEIGEKYTGERFWTRKGLRPRMSNE